MEEIERSGSGKFYIPERFLKCRPVRGVRKNGPLLGQDNEKSTAVMLGYNHHDLVKLRQSGVFKIQSFVI
jgi:hypothetical protein